jgi:hypothetical protein
VAAAVLRETIERDILYIKIQFVPLTVWVRYVDRTVNYVQENKLFSEIHKKHINTLRG